MRKKFKRNSKTRSGFFRRGAVHDRKFKKNCTVRPCLSCNEDFKSEGNYNRICNLCKGTEEWEMGNDYSIMRQS